MTYLEVLGCLGTALVELLGGEVDFKVVVADLRLGDLSNHICYKFSELFGCKSEGLIGFWLREGVLAYC